MPDNKNKPRTTRGMFDDEQKEEPKTYSGMFAEDEAAHHMTKKKQTVIAVVLIVLVFAGMVAMIIARRKWNRSILARYMAAPRSAWSETSPAGSPESAEWAM